MRDLVQTTTDLAGAASGFLRLFPTVDCTGDAYFIYDGDVGSGHVTGGVVIAATDVLAYSPYYVPRNASRVGVTILRKSNGMFCSDQLLGFRDDLVLAIPNDPATTGISNSPYVPPLHVQTAPTSLLFLLFKDGFESSSLMSAQARERAAA